MKPDNDKIPADSNIRKLVIWTIALFVMICAAPLLTKIFSLGDLYCNTFGAIIGVALSAIITFVLLNGQSRLDVLTNKKQLEDQSKQALDNDRASKVYEEKLKIYQDFLVKLYDIIKDGKVTEDESLSLQFAVSALAMHSSSATVKSISCNLRSILDNIGIRAQEGGGDESACILGDLMEIVKTFRQELYMAEPSVEDNTALADALAEFSAIGEAVALEPEKQLRLPSNYTEEDIREALEEICENTDDITPADGGWRFDVSALLKQEGKLNINLGYRPEYGLLFQVTAQLESQEQERGLYLYLRRIHKGQMNRYGWWLVLPHNVQRLLLQTEHLNKTDIIFVKRSLKLEFLSIYVILRKYGIMQEIAGNIQTQLSLSPKMQPDSLVCTLENATDHETWTLLLKETSRNRRLPEFDVVIGAPTRQQLDKQLERWNWGADEADINRISATQYCMAKGISQQTLLDAVGEVVRELQAAR